jgi:hypothetical protein
MVGPIDYTMQVLDPIQGYMKGLAFGEDLQNSQLGREQTRQTMGIQQTQEARAAQEFEMRKAEAARKQADAQRGQQVLGELLSNPSPTSEDFTKAYLANPAIREEVKFLMGNQSAEVTKAQLSSAQNLYAAAAQNNLPIVERLLTEQRDAAKNGGNEQMYQLADEGLKMLQSDPEMAMKHVRTSTGLSILGLGGDIKKVNEAIGINEQKDAVSPLGKIAQDVSSGIIPKSVLDSAIAVDKAAADGGLTLPQKISEEARLRGEYSKRTEDLSAAERNFSIIETSAADNSGAGDIALVTSFMKMLDPGSVVRETEFATAANTGGLLAKLKSAVTKIEDGKFLSPEQRTDFQRLAGKYLEAANAQEQGVQSSYQAIIDNYGLNPVNVFGARAATAAAPSGAPAVAEVQPAPADAASGSIPLSFMSNESVKNAAAAAGVTPEEIWAVMPDDVRATYGR